MAEFDSIDTGVEPVVGEAKAVFERAAKGDGRAIEVLDKVIMKGQKKMQVFCEFPM